MRTSLPFSARTPRFRCLAITLAGVVTAGAALIPNVASAAIVASNCAEFNGTQIGLSLPNGPTRGLGFVAGDVITIQLLSVGASTADFQLFDESANGQLLATVSAVGSVTFTVTAAQVGHELAGSGHPNAQSSIKWFCTPASQGALAPKTSKDATQLALLNQMAANMAANMANMLNATRQHNRLVEEGYNTDIAKQATGKKAGFTSDEQLALDVATGTATAPRLGLGMSGVGSAMPLGSQLGLRAGYDDDLTSPMRTRGPGGSDTNRGGGASIAGLNIFGSGDSGGSLNFSTSLRDITRATEQQEAQRLANDPTAAALGFTGTRASAGSRRPNPLDVWVEGRFLRLNDGRNGADLHGYSGLFNTGVDYVFNRNLLAGVSLSYDMSGQKSSTQGTETRGGGWLAGPYATVRLSDSVFWQSRAAWGRASTDVTVNAGSTDSVDSTRWLTSTQLSGR